LRAQDERDGK